MGRPVDKLTNQKNESEEVEVEHYMQSHTDSRLVMLHGEVSEQSIALVSGQIIHLSLLNNLPIKLIISTYGGAVDEMFGLYDVIKMVNCPVHTIALGKVMSAGVLLLSSGEKGKRSVGPHTRLMIHGVSGMAYGNVFDVTNQAEEQKRLQDLMVELLSKESKMTKKEIEKIMVEKVDKFIDAKTAVKLGIVDVIV